jgi:Thiol-disulfide isomerase and thioredoxins
MKRIIVLSITVLTSMFAFSQGFSLDDSTIVFRDKTGTLMNKEQVLSIMKGKFSVSTQNLPDGKKVLTIIPLSETEMDQSKKEKEVFIKSLLDKKLAGFSFHDINGNLLDGDKLRGKIVVLNFWFTACKPCIMEMPALNKLVSTYKGKSVVFIAPTFDRTQLTKQFLTKRQFDYIIIPEARSYMDSLNVTIFPTHLVVDRNGIIRKVIVGYSEEVTKEIAEMINKIDL